MRYLMTYVRQLPFQEEPDYELLDHCLNFGQYLHITAWHQQLKTLKQETDEEGAPAAAAAPGAAGGGQVVPGAKRKRDGKGEDGAEDGGLPDAKRVRGEPPPEPCRAFMWFVISINPLEGREAFSSHTTYQNLITKVNDFWKQGLWIKHICFDGSLYTALFNSNHKYAQQTVSHQTSLEDLKRFMKEYWNKGYYVTSLARDAVGWGIVVTKFQPHQAYYKQSYCVSCMIPINWIKQKWQKDFYITCARARAPATACAAARAHISRLLLRVLLAARAAVAAFACCRSLSRSVCARSLAPPSALCAFCVFRRSATDRPLPHSDKPMPVPTHSDACAGASPSRTSRSSRQW
jgi:hypothetical protein